MAYGFLPFVQSQGIICLLTAPFFTLNRVAIKYYYVYIRSRYGAQHILLCSAAKNYIFVMIVYIPICKCNNEKKF